MRDLSAGNRHLAAWRLNTEIDLAQAYPLQGNKAKAFEYLRRVVAKATVPSLADFLEREKAFHSIRDDPGLTTVVSGFHVFDHSHVLKTPYKIFAAHGRGRVGKVWSNL